MPRLEITATKANEWRWRKRGRNGQIVSTSGESFKNRGHAIRQAKREYPQLSDRCYLHTRHGISQI